MSSRARPMSCWGGLYATLKGSDEGLVVHCKSELVRYKDSSHVLVNRKKNELLVLYLEIAALEIINTSLGDGAEVTSDYTIGSILSLANSDVSETLKLASREFNISIRG